MYTPEAVQLRAKSQGAVAQHWLQQLPTTIQDLCDKWDLTVGTALDGGTESIVLPATRTDGTLAILKIGMPNVCNVANEALILELANGQGYAKLYALESDHNAMLIERLGPQLAAANLSIDAQIHTICTTLQAAWHPLTNSHGFMTGAEKAQWLATFIETTWRELGRPCSKPVIATALDFCAQRITAHATADCVLVHGDAHEHNTLTADENTYKFVDPDGLYAEKACDLAVPMRGWAEELLGGETVKLGIQRCELLADLTKVTPTAIWQWGFIERVSTGLVLLQIGLVDEGKQYLEVADIFATSKVYSGS